MWVDDKIERVLRSTKFVEFQGLKIKLVISFQDNTSIIKLLENGRRSEGKRTRHFDIRLFHTKDLIDRKEVVVDHFSSDEMIDDYMSNN